MTLSLSDLSPRRRAVAELVGEGLSYREIADRLGIDVETARSATNRVSDKIPRAPGDDRTAYRRVMRWVLEQQRAA